MFAGLPHWTSPQTFGHPQDVILGLLLALVSAFAALSVFTVVHEFRAMRRSRPANR